MAKLRRVSDGAGDSGSLSEALKWDGDNKVECVGNRPILGASMRVGSPFAGTYSKQDWWLTTAVTDIIEDTGDYVKFKTGNSTYEWWQQ